MPDTRMNHKSLQLWLNIATSGLHDNADILEVAWALRDPRSQELGPIKLHCGVPYHAIAAERERKSDPTLLSHWERYTSYIRHRHTKSGLYDRYKKHLDAIVAKNDEYCCLPDASVDARSVWMMIYSDIYQRQSETGMDGPVVLCGQGIAFEHRRLERGSELQHFDNISHHLFDINTMRAFTDWEHQFDVKGIPSFDFENQKFDTVAQLQLEYDLYQFIRTKFSPVK